MMEHPWTHPIFIMLWLKQYGVHIILLVVSTCIATSCKVDNQSIHPPFLSKQFYFFHFAALCIPSLTLHRLACSQWLRAMYVIGHLEWKPWCDAKGLRRKIHTKNGGAKQPNRDNQCAQHTPGIATKETMSGGFQSNQLPTHMDCVCVRLLLTASTLPLQ